MTRIVVERTAEREVLGIFLRAEDGYVGFNVWETGELDWVEDTEVEVVDGEIAYRGPGGLREIETATWDLAVYSEDYVSKPELTEVNRETCTEWTLARLKTKRDIWEELKRCYPDKFVPVFYADGTRGGFVVPRAVTV